MVMSFPPAYVFSQHYKGGSVKACPACPAKHRRLKRSGKLAEGPKALATCPPVVGIQRL
jgi:hypothetical protein